MDCGVIETFAYRLGFRWPTLEARQAIEEILLPTWTLESGDGQADCCFEIEYDDSDYRLSLDGKSQGVAKDQVRLVSLLERSVHLQLATYAPHHVFVHAGVVAFPAGLVVLPGRSMQGKSTLVRALVEAGGRYFSDEYAVIDEQGLVHPYPRHHSHRLSGGQKELTPASTLGWELEFGPRSIALLLSTGYQEGAEFQPTTITVGQAALKMFANTVSAQTDPARAMTYLPRALAQAQCWEGSRGEAAAAAAVIVSLLDQDSHDQA